MVYKYTILIFIVFLSSCAPQISILKKFQPSEILNLPITETRAYFAPYQEFCSINPGECDLSGQAIIDLTPHIWNRLKDINAAVNHDIELCLDQDQYQKEEYWTYPKIGQGDCEDIALEKRSRLVSMGTPRGALRIAIGYHKKTLTPHAVLTVETTKGTYVMDSLDDQIHIWYKTPYNFETRERPDGRWDRYDQELWTFY